MSKSQTPDEKGQDKSAMSWMSVLRQRAKIIFDAGLKEVMPDYMVPKWVHRSGDELIIGENRFTLRKNVYIIGYGKAVGGMARALQEILSIHLVKGIISIPTGTVEFMRSLNKMNQVPFMDGKIQLFEGAKDNIPDEAAFQAAKAIVSFASTLKETDLLLVLISGGGSALFPYPVPPLSLQEKAHTITLLFKSGAGIDEVNSVRKCLSYVKGGKLLHLTKAKVIALILSDVINDPLSTIASGTTVCECELVQPLSVLKKYNIEDKVSKNVLKVLRQGLLDFDKKVVPPPAYNFIIGSNKLAVHAAKNSATKFGYASFILSTTMSGEAREVGKLLVHLIIRLYSSSTPVMRQKYSLAEIGSLLDIKFEVLKQLERLCETAFSENKPVCILSSGETTVKVKGSGIGGRNQELALGAAVEFGKIMSSLQTSAPEFPTLLYSAGTDGKDGPNDAAGAIAYPELCEEAEKCGLNPEQFLENNDSFNFYKKFNAGQYHVITGHTGTNVMDIQIIIMLPVSIHHD